MHITVTSRETMTQFYTLVPYPSITNGHGEELDAKRNERMNDQDETKSPKSNEETNAKTNERANQRSHDERCNLKFGK